MENDKRNVINKVKKSTYLKKMKNRNCKKLKRIKIFSFYLLNQVFKWKSKKKKNTNHFQKWKYCRLYTF